MMKFKGFSPLAKGLTKGILCVLVFVTTASGEDYTKRFLLGEYNGHTKWGMVDVAQDKLNHAGLHLNFLYGYPDEAKDGFYDNYCSEEMKASNAVSAYSIAERISPLPTTLEEWKDLVPTTYLNLNGTYPNLISSNLGEEAPEFYDKIYFDAMNYVISEVYQERERGSDQLITFNQGGYACRPDLLLWVDNIDFMWFYPHCFTFTYQTSDAWYQDSLQRKCVDAYNRIAQQVKICRKWGNRPNLHWKANMSAWQQPEGGHRKPNREEMFFEAWLCFSRGAKGLTHFLYQNQIGGWVGLVDAHNKPHIEGGPDNVYHDEDGNDVYPTEGTLYDGDAMFTWAGEVFAQFEGVNTNLKEPPYNYENGLYDVDVDTFRSVQGDMTIPLFYVRQITVTPPAGKTKNDVYSELSIHHSSYRDNFLLLINRSLQLPQSIFYEVKVGVPWGEGANWELVDVITGTVYHPETPQPGDQEDELRITTLIPPSEAKFFILKYNGTEGEALVSNCREATGYSNGRKIVMSKIHGEPMTFLAYTDLEGTTPHIDYASSNDLGTTWDVSEKIPNSESPALAVTNGFWPVMAYIDRGTEYKLVYKVRDCDMGTEIELCRYSGTGWYSPPSIAIHEDALYGYVCHVTFCVYPHIYHYVIKKEDFTQSHSNPTYEHYDLYWPNPPAPRRPCVVCDSSGRAYVFFAYEPSGPNGQNSYIHLWDGKSKDAVQLPFAQGWDGTAVIEDPAILLTWVALAESPWPRGEIHAKYGLLKYNSSAWWPQWLQTNEYENYEVVDPNFDRSEVQPIGTTAALWQSQYSIIGAVRNENGRDRDNPWSSTFGLESDARCPQSAFEPELFKYATAWTKGTTAPYTIVANVNDISSMQGGNGSDVLVISPNGGEKWRPGETRTITWSSMYEYTNEWYWKVHLSTDGGENFDYEFTYSNKGLVTRTPTLVGNTYTWQIRVPNRNSSQCRLKIVCDHLAGDPQDISDRNFSIGNAVPWPNYYNITGVQPPGIEKGIYWEDNSSTGMPGVDLELSLDNGNSWEEPMLLSSTIYPPDDSLLIDTLFGDTDTAYYYKYWGTFKWTVPNSPTSAAKIKLTAHDTLGDTASKVQDSSFVIPLPGGWAYNTYSNQELWGLNKAGDKLDLFYVGSDPFMPIIYYTSSPDGYSLNTPESLGIGRFPCHQRGFALWLSRNRDTIFASHWIPQIPQWAGGNPILIGAPGTDSTRHSPIGIDVDADTVHAVFERCFYYHAPSDTVLGLFHLAILKETGAVIDTDTLNGPTTNGVQSDIAPSVQAQGGSVYAAYGKGNMCWFGQKMPSGQFPMMPVGLGYYPIVSLTEGNVIFTYLATDFKSLIRLWRYRDDTNWVGGDTFALQDSVRFLTCQNGIMYSLQVGDSVCKTYLYDPLGKEFIPRETRQGSYPHSYLWRCADDQWTECYTAYLDTFRFVKTETQDLNAFFPALYQEARLRRSPYTLWRDTCIDYHECTVDYGADSLIYQFNRLNPLLSYCVMVEFYFESETPDTIRILSQLGGQIDTVEVPNNTFLWHYVQMPSYDSSFTLKLYKLGSGDFVPVSRLTVGQIDLSNILIAGCQGDGKIPLAFCLYQPFPNPFSDAVTIRYSLPYATHVSLKVYDVVGRLVSKLVDKEVLPGVHTLRWEGCDDINRRCASGVYFVRFEADDYVAAKKMVLLK